MEVELVNADAVSWTVTLSELSDMREPQIM